MRHHFASWVVVLSAISCGGSSETADFSSAGSSSGGTSNAGSATGGSATGGSATGGSAGKGGSASGGTSSAGSTSGGTGTSGSTGQAGMTSGGSGPVDPNCPPTRPMGTCDDAGTSCQYDFTNCLCYPTAPGTFIQCQKVDPTCTGVVQAAPADGTGGISAKVALPPRQVCTCTAGSWMCAFGG
ncbi:MAG TPA: hypothetical protein VHP33_31530 [Polyangiaceae bacterium]|nr:hypothetical protein [Polyangiaceae bacterium]